MKRCFFISLALLASNMQGFAQKFLNIYQDRVVIKQISTTEIDSISVTETEPSIISMWSNGNVSLTYTSEEIDSITVTNQSGYPFSYVGIVGFNDQLYMKDIGILSEATKNDYKSFVNGLSRKNGTMLYYAVDIALDMLDKANIKTPLKNVTLIIFTDGLDQGSLMMTDKYETSNEYLEAMSKRITSTTVNGIPINAYSVGLCGNDVTNVSLFSQNLRYLASSEENCYELSNISGLSGRLKAIANQIINVSKRQTISIEIPGVDSGTRERITFDGKPAESSQLYIEGTFNRKDLSLHDVTYHGLKATSGTMVQGTQNGIFVTYTFMGLRLETGSGLIPTSNIQHYYMLPSTSSWQKNTEFGSSKDTQTSVSHSGATIFLILDCSSSLGSDFSKMQQYSNEFINMIANNAEPFSLNAPENVKAKMDENEWAVNISWDAVKYAEYYSVYRSSNSSLSFRKVADSLTVKSWCDESPLNGSNYYRVYAISHGLKSSASSTTKVVNCSLSSPTNLIAVMDDKERAVNLSWDPVKYAEYYSVYRYKSSSSSSPYVVLADSLTVTFCRDEAPLDGNNYYIIYAKGHETQTHALVTINAEIEKSPLCPDNRHPHKIDLGLPSGTKWACCNIGAHTPEKYGGYFAWGEKETKKNYVRDTYKYYQNESFVNIGYDITGTEYDVAHVIWGGTWQMPTSAQQKELLDNCTYEWTSEKGVNGVRFTSMKNGASIFLPAAGMISFQSLVGESTEGCYWSSMHSSSLWDCSFSLNIKADDVSFYFRDQYHGLTVRPVSK